jgi:uncharacterized protein DUF2510
VAVVSAQPLDVCGRSSERRVGLDWRVVVMAASRRTRAGSRRRGLVAAGAFAGWVVGVTVGFWVAPAQIAVPGMCALGGLALGALVGWAVSARHGGGDPGWVAEERLKELPPPGPWPAPPEADPGWYPDPRSDSAQRYWDGEAWTEHLWRGRG